MLGEVFYIYKALAANLVGPDTANGLEFLGERRYVEIGFVRKGVCVDLHWDPPKPPRPVRELEHSDEQKSGVRTARRKALVMEKLWFD